jgi:CRP-like cAMP-binding protein
MVPKNFSSSDRFVSCLLNLFCTLTLGEFGDKGGERMTIKQADLFLGVSHHFVKDVMAISVKESYAEGAFLFHTGDPATHFYILMQGRVKLGLGETGQKVYIGSQLGETFGWSSLIGRDTYSASAICMEPTHLLKIENQKLQQILEKDSSNGIIFYQRLAKTLGNRLLQSYEIISDLSKTEFNRPEKASDSVAPSQ